MDNNVLEKLHRAELDILMAFDRVCRDNGLTYFLDSGTALGAVRHGGFIPWDDDIDVGMPRKDFELFIKIAQQYLPCNIFLQTRETDPTYTKHSPKLRMEGTIFEEKNETSLLHRGIYIDIFPFDYLPGNKYLAVADIYLARLMAWVVRYWRCKKRSPNVIRRSINRIVNLLPKNVILGIDNFYIQFCKKLQNHPTSKVTCYYWGMAQLATYIFETRKMWPTKQINFEGRMFSIVNTPDHYLTIMYGDYMQLPPEEKRNCHLYGRIEFGDI